MAPNYVTLTLDLYDGSGNKITEGTAYLTPNTPLKDATDHQFIPQVPVAVEFSPSGLPTVSLLATDNASVAPSGWVWTVTWEVPFAPPSFAFALPYASGSSQYLSAQLPALSTAPMSAYLPLIYPVGAVPGYVWTAAAGGVGSWESAAVSSLYSVQPSGDTSGVTDAANISSAISGLPTGGGVVTMAPGTYYWTCGSVVITSAQVYIRGAGRWATTVRAVGTGDLLRVYNTSLTGALTGGGIYDLTLDGTSAGAGSTGLHLGDMRATEISLAIQNFSGTGDIGLYLDNEYAWTEECHGYCWLSNNTQNVVFSVGTATTTSTNSFGYSDFYFEILAKVNQDGVVFQNGALFYHSSLKVKANFEGSASAQSSAVIRITGQMPAGHPDSNYSLIKACRLDVQAETNSSLGSNQPATIIFGSPSNNVIADCFGIMDFSFGSTFASATNSSGSFAFDGPVLGDSKLWRTQGGGTNFNVGNLLTNGTTIQPFSDSFTMAPTANLTGMVIEKWPAAMGTPVGFTIINSGSASVTMDVAATSHVSNGTDCVILPNTSMRFAWNPVSGLWTPQQQPASGRYLCSPLVYAPASQTTVSVSSTTFAAFSSGVVCTNSFAAPSSGEVVVDLSCAYEISSGGQKFSFALAATGTVTPIVGQEITALYTTGSSLTYATFRFVVTGLTPGTSYQFDLLGAVASGTLSILAIGSTGTTQGSAGAPVILTVQAV